MELQDPINLCHEILREISKFLDKTDLVNRPCLVGHDVGIG